MTEQKQVIIMRKDLKMNRGKIAAQAAHASMKIFFDRITDIKLNEDGSADITIHFNKEMKEWREGPFTKTCLQVHSEEELLEIYKQAQEKDLPVALITDSGQTTFHNVPTNTCIAIGPANRDKIDEITGHLKLMS